MPHILIIDADPRMRTTLLPQLRAAGHQPRLAPSGPVGLALLARFPTDLVLLDTELGAASGFDTCREIRRFSDVPIIFYSAHADVDRRVLGLAIGGDDYVAKPAEPLELIARIDAVLRRCRSVPGGSTAGQLHGRPFVLDQFSQRVMFGNSRAVNLTPTEFRLLEYLVLNAQHILSPGQILSRVWERCDSHDYSLVSTYILRLRNKLERDPANPEHIITVWNMGYKFVSIPSAN